MYRATGLPVEGSVNNLNFGMYDYVSEFTLTIDSVGTGFYQVARFLCLASIYYILVYLYIVLLASIISQFICILLKLRFTYMLYICTHHSFRLYISMLLNELLCFDNLLLVFKQHALKKNQ